MTRRAFTLIELVAAAVIGAVVAGGTLMAFVTAIRIHSRTGATDVAFLLQQTLEKYRNHIACDDDLWFKTTTCEMNITPCKPKPGELTECVCEPDPDDPTKQKCFTEDKLPDDANLTGMIRNWMAEPEDCDGDGNKGDCLRLTARIVANQVPTQ